MRKAKSPRKPRLAVGVNAGGFFLWKVGDRYQLELVTIIQSHRVP